MNRDDDPDPSEDLTPTDRLADLLDELLAMDTAMREARLALLAESESGLAAELRELIDHLPDPEPRSAAERAERGEQDPFVGEPEVGETIGGCVLESVLGRGGVGTVFAARQIDPPRPVAVKVLRLGNARMSHLRRFRVEAHALARLVHPTLARIYSSGASQRAGVEVPYIVMERIEAGRSFIDWARDPGRSQEAIARCLARVCEGMQHGHNRGVIHRDLKPSNVLVDSDDRPHVIDFGIARLVSGDPTAPGDTLVGALIGTPAYMAPEQFELDPAELDARIDIHALGVILYESVTGRRPYEIPRYQYFDAARIMRETNPPAPHLVDSAVSRDLSAIIMMAMARDRDRRYTAMSELADDLRAFAAGESVRARPAPGHERVWRLMRRHRAWTTAVVVSFAALVSATVVATEAYRSAERARLRAKAELATIDAERGLVPTDQFAPLDFSTIEPPVLAGMLRREVDDGARPTIAGTYGNMMAGAMSPDGRRWAAGSDGREYFVVETARGDHVIREVETTLSEDRQLRPGQAPTHGLYAMGFSYDGSRVFAGMLDGAIVELLPDAVAPGGRKSRTIQFFPHLLRAILPAADGRRLLLVSAQGVAMLDLETEAPVEFNMLADGIALGGAAWNGEGPAYAVMGDRSVVALEIPPLRDGGPPRKIEGFEVETADARSIALSPDGSRIAVGENSGFVLICDARTGAILHRASVRHAVWSLAFDRAGETFFAGDRGGRIHQIDARTGAILQTLAGGVPEPVWALGVAENGLVLASIGYGTHTFDPSPRWSSEPPALGMRVLSSVCIGNRAIRAICTDGIVRELEFGDGAWRETEHGAIGPTRVAALSRDGTKVACLQGAVLVIVDLSTGERREIGCPEQQRGKSYQLRWNADGTRFSLVGWQLLRLYSSDGELLAETPIDTHEYARATWYGGDRLVVLSGVEACYDCVYLDGAISASLTQIPAALAIVWTGGRWVLPSLNGSVAVTHKGGPDRLRQGADGFEWTLQRHRDSARTAAVSPDDTILATGGIDGTVRLWSLATGEQITSFSALDEQVDAVFWLEDGSALVAIGRNGTLRFFDSVPRWQRVAGDGQDSTANPRPAYGQ
jgi:WD40 repeat protein